MIVHIPSVGQKWSYSDFDGARRPFTIRNIGQSTMDLLFPDNTISTHYLNDFAKLINFDKWKPLK